MLFLSGFIFMRVSVNGGGGDRLVTFLVNAFSAYATLQFQKFLRGFRNRPCRRLLVPGVRGLHLAWQRLARGVL